MSRPVHTRAYSDQADTILNGFLYETLEDLDTPAKPHRMLKKTVQQGRSEQKAEAYAVGM